MLITMLSASNLWFALKSPNAQQYVGLQLLVCAVNLLKVSVLESLLCRQENGRGNTYCRVDRPWVTPTYRI